MNARYFVAGRGERKYLSSVCVPRELELELPLRTRFDNGAMAQKQHKFLPLLSVQCFEQFL